MERLQVKSLNYNLTKYTVEVSFDQPYYYSSEKIKCSLKINYVKCTNDIKIDEKVRESNLLDYITIQLYGYTSYSNEILNLINSSTNKTNSLNNLISNLFNINNRIDLINKNIKGSNIKNKPIFVSNPYVLISDVNLIENKGDIGTFLYTCYLPPFIPPTFNGKFISFNYIALITIGVNNMKSQYRLNEDNVYNNLISKSPVIQKKLRFEIRCLGPHPKSSRLLFPLLRKSNNYYPITSINNYFKDDSIDDLNSMIIDSSEKIPSLVDTIYTNSEVYDIEVFNVIDNNPKFILKNLLNLYKRKNSYLKNIISQNESLIAKTRFFELNGKLDTYTCLNNFPKSLFEIYWEHEISTIFYPNELFEDKYSGNNINNNENDENLIINYKNELVLNCNIYNINEWSNDSPIVIHFDFSDSYWKTQEINITLRRIEKLNDDDNNNESFDDIIIYNYKRCTLWDLEFTHQIQPLSSNIIYSMITDNISIFYQLTLDFYIFNISKKVRNVNFLDLNIFQDIIKLSWNSNRINFNYKNERLNFKNVDLINDQVSLNEYFIPMVSILSNNNISVTKFVEF